MKQDFHNTPIYRTCQPVDENPHLLVLKANQADLSTITQALTNDKLVLLTDLNIENAGDLFGRLVDHYGLRDSYDIQMQYVVNFMEGREAVDDIAVTVNERDTLQYIQAHCEGDSSSPLDLFGLHCSTNATIGGENILSLIDQSADFSHLRAKEKIIVGQDLSPQDIGKLRMNHLDAKKFRDAVTGDVKVLEQSDKGRPVIAKEPVEQVDSIINHRPLYSLWDNVTVHDHAFHRHQFELLRHLEILCGDNNVDYQDYMHVEHDSDWAPADTDSADVETTATLFKCHIAHKMQANELLLFNNKAWAHSVNNWPENQQRQLCAMYA